MARSTGTSALTTVKRREWEVIDKSTQRVLKIVAEATSEGNQVLVEKNGILKVGTKTSDGVSLRDGSPSYDAKVIGKLK